MGRGLRSPVQPKGFPGVPRALGLLGGTLANGGQGFQAPSCPPLSAPHPLLGEFLPGVSGEWEVSQGPPPLQVTVMCGLAWKDHWAHHSFSGSCQSWKAYVAPGKDVSQVPAWRGERAGDDDRLGRGREKRVSAPRAPGFLLCPRPVCSAFLGSLGSLSRALEKPRFTGAHLCTTTRVLEHSLQTQPLHF